MAAAAEAAAEAESGEGIRHQAQAEPAHGVHEGGQGIHHLLMVLMMAIVVLGRAMRMAVLAASKQAEC